MKEALLYSSNSNKIINCLLCCHHCQILPGRRGLCKVRENNSGKLYSLVYGRTIATHIDPIEKKPFFHFLPGTKTLSIATVGCNFHCRNCQNYDISQFSNDDIPGKQLSPSQLIKLARENNVPSIAYTYTEPTVFFEYAYDTAKIAHQNGIRNLFVTNGFMTPAALKMIAPYLDGANVDLKAFSDKFYQEVCGARLQPVLASLKLMKKLNIWLEITTLLIPGLNDSTHELQQLVRFIKEELGPQTPWHVSRFHPDYQLTDTPSTPLATLKRAEKIATGAGLKYVYTGNVSTDNGENTSCPHCGRLLLKRRLFEVVENNLRTDQCPQCQATITGIFN